LSSMTATVTRRRGTVYRTAALGTHVELLVTDPDELVAASRILLAELTRIDEVASRFRPDSEISRLHRAGGRQVRVSDDLLETVRVALHAAEASDGAVDPTVGGALIELGYDRDFSQLAGGVPGRLPAARAVPGWRAVEVDVEACTISVPSGVLLDLGATAKALAADRVATRVHHQCGCGVLVSLGGDLAVAGAPAEGFAVELGEDCREVVGDLADSVAIGTGGMATSGTQVRWWRLGDHRVHHLIDPATGLPVTTVWRTVTVCGETCVDANTASTAAMVKGVDALRWLESLALPARLISVDGEVTTTATWPTAPADRSARP
jgi:thiamine biosynthesis lipoprotein ApbE